MARHSGFSKRGRVKARKFAKAEDGGNQGGDPEGDEEVIAQGGQDAEKHNYSSKKEVRKQGVFSTNAIIGKGSPNKKITRLGGPEHGDRMRVKGPRYGE